MKYAIGRHIEGVSLNPLEFLLDSKNEIMLFETKQGAISYMAEVNLIAYQQAEDSFIFIPESELD